MLKSLCAVILIVSTAGLAGAQTLHVYGPGGPLAPVKECAALYQQKTGVQVEVTAGPEKQWFAAAETDADIIFGGAEYMLTEFDLNHKGFLLSGSRVELYDRAVGILVRPGNPKHIRSLADLATPGVQLLDVSGAGQTGLWEDLAGRKGLIRGIAPHISVSVSNTAEGLELWKTRPELDAWISYESWVRRMDGRADLVRLPENERLYRGTPAAIASRSNFQDQARSFLAFLQSSQAHAVFVKWGWR